MPKPLSSSSAERKRRAHLLERARPAWLIVATVLQIGTYLADASIWKTVLARSGERQPLRRFVRLGLAKLIIDQAIPSGGLSGTMLIVRALDKSHPSRKR